MAAKNSGFKVDNLSSHPKPKTLEYRLCKKVAELTQVVHMLFTRNHEKEIELETVKRAYEDEIDIVIKDAKARLESANKKLQDLEKQVKDNSPENVKNLIDSAVKQSNESWNAKIRVFQEQEDAHKKEIATMKETLESSRRDLDNMRKGKGGEVQQLQSDLLAKRDEIAMLKTKLSQLENEVREAEAAVMQSSSDYQLKAGNLQNELKTLKENLHTVERSNESLTQRNKQLESELRIIKKELTRRSSAQHLKPSLATALRKEDLSQDQSEELEKLRREIQRYRMELSNRENNFNRVFAEKQPTHVDRRAANERRSLPAFHTAQGEVLVRFARERSGVNLDLVRERSMPPSNTPSTPSLRSYGEVPDPFENGLDHRAPMTPILRGNRNYAAPPRTARSRTGRSSQTPQLEEVMPTSKGQKLTKPKPLPRDMVSYKNTY